MLKQKIERDDDSKKSHRDEQTSSDSVGNMPTFGGVLMCPRPD
jgi:hypothetical protein